MPTLYAYEKVIKRLWPMAAKAGLTYQELSVLCRNQFGCMLTLLSKKQGLQLAKTIRGLSGKN